MLYFIFYIFQLFEAKNDVQLTGQNEIWMVNYKGCPSFGLIIRHQ